MASLTFGDIRLKPALLRAMQRKAKHEGKTPPEYVRWLIERDVLADQSFDDILRPIRDDFRKSGITEAQLDAIVDRARHPSRNTLRRASRAAKTRT